LPTARKRVDQPLVDRGRVRVHHAHPAQAGALEAAQLDEQLGQPVAGAQVLAVVGAVLGDERQLACAERRERAGLLDEHGQRLALELAADLGDRAEGADVVAALAQAQVGRVRRGEQRAAEVAVGLLDQATGARGRGRRGARNARGVGPHLARRAHRARCAAEHRVHDRGHAAVVAERQPGVDLGQLLRQPGAVQLDETARDDHAAHAARALERDLLADRGQALLPRLVDEAAGVHDHDVAVGRVGDERHAGAPEVPDHDLAVDERLAAAERDEADVAGGRSSTRRSGGGVDGIGDAAGATDRSGAAQGSARIAAGWAQTFEVADCDLKQLRCGQALALVPRSQRGFGDAELPLPKGSKLLAT
jgi:hypothetical protein